MTTESIDLRGMIRPGDGIVWSQGGAEPTRLLTHLLDQAGDIGPLSGFAGVTLTKVLDHPAVGHGLSLRGYNATGVLRSLANDGRFELVGCHLSQVPRLLAGGEIRCDVALVSVAPADRENQHSLGVGVDYMPAAIASARVVIGEMNRQMPPVGGPYRLPTSRLAACLETDAALPTLPPAGVSAVGNAIARSVAELVEDGATLQVGIGGLVGAAIRGLAHHRDLGVHTGLLGDEVVDLIAAGVVTNVRKELDRGRTVTAMVLGSEATYRFVGECRDVEVHPVTYTHSPTVLGSFKRLTTINGALGADLLGNLNLHGSTQRARGGLGGQLDFGRAAMASEHGVSIVVLPSTTSTGRSSIVGGLPASELTVAGADVDVVVTEFGVARLRGKTARERAKAMLAVAAPEFRTSLEREFRSS